MTYKIMDGTLCVEKGIEDYSNALYRGGLYINQCFADLESDIVIVNEITNEVECKYDPTITWELP